MIKIEIYTLGHSNYSFDKFIEILKKYNINCVVDIRAIPYSKYNTQYNKEFFQANLKKLGYTYIYIQHKLRSHIQFCGNIQFAIKPDPDLFDQLDHIERQRDV